MKSAIVLLLVLMSLSATSQDKFLAIERPGHVKRIKFPVGTELKFKIKGDKFYSIQTIDDVYDSTVVLSGKFINLADIDGIKYKSSNVLLRNLAYKFPAFAVVLLAFSAINSTAAADDNDVVFTEFALTGASGLISIGIVSHIIRNKSHRFKGRKRLKVIDSRIQVN